MRFADVLAAELSKLRTLPAAVLAAAAGVVAAAAIAAAVAASAPGRDGAPVADAVSAAVPFVQAGMILLGVLPVSHEYAGRQLSTTLTAVPERRMLLAGKTAAAAVAIALTAAAAVGAAAAAAAIARGVAGDPVALGDDPQRLPGAVAYLAAIGMLAHAATLLLRYLVLSLAVVLSTVMIVSPVLASVSEHARWLPDRAAAELYGSMDAVLTVGTGALVAACWVAGIWLVGAARFIRRDV